MRQHPRHLSVNDLDHLLSRGRLSGPAKDRVLHAVLDQTASSTWFFQRWLEHGVPRWALGSAALAVAVLAVALWGVLAPRPQAVPEFEARGGGTAVAGPQVEAACVGPCKVGGLLVLRVQHVPEVAYVAAYAVGPKGQRIWYFPAQPGNIMPQVQPTQTTPLRQGIRLGTEHAAGAYTLHTLFLRSPMSRNDIDKLATAPRTDLVVGQVDSTFEVLP